MKRSESWWKLIWMTSGCAYLEPSMKADAGQFMPLLVSSRMVKARNKANATSGPIKGSVAEATAAALSMHLIRKAQTKGKARAGHDRPAAAERKDEAAKVEEKAPTLVTRRKAERLRRAKAEAKASRRKLPTPRFEEDLLLAKKTKGFARSSFVENAAKAAKAKLATEMPDLFRNRFRSKFERMKRLHYLHVTP